MNSLNKSVRRKKIEVVIQRLSLNWTMGFEKRVIYYKVKVEVGLRTSWENPP